MNNRAKVTFEELEQTVVDLQSDFRCPDDRYVAASLTEAIASAREGNDGVGAVLVDTAGQIIERGRNRVFYPHFRSDLHAEMDLVTSFEEHHQRSGELKELALYTSLEPCPMCLTRLIFSGIGKVFYAARDESGGMVSRMRYLPPFWKDLARPQMFAPARCSQLMSDVAREIAWLQMPRTTGSCGSGGCHSTRSA